MLRLLELVRLSRRTVDRYRAELSGGERQSVAIARALAAEPDLLVRDEITSALDASVQAAVLELLADPREQVSLSMLYISHDLGVVASVADRVLILREGVICEEGPGRGAEATAARVHVPPGYCGAAPGGLVDRRRSR